MTNGLILFVGTLVFLVFGYASLVRIAHKAYFSTNTVIKSEVLPFFTQLLSQLGQGALFIHFATLSLLLFWGWGTALLWLILFHLVTETTFNLQQGVIQRADNKVKHSHTTKLILLVRQLFLILILSIGTALLIKLINQQSGLVFILLAVFIAHTFIFEEITITTVLASLLVLFAGLWFSHELGIAIYGSISPFDSFVDQQAIRDYFVWLNFDNNSVISLTLIIGVFMLSRREHFRTDLSILSGVLILTLLCAFLVKLFWLSPFVDAPLNSLQVSENGLPPFSSFALFIFAGLTALLMRDKSHSNNNAHQNSPHGAGFASSQLSSLLTILVAVLLVLALACALGIGAWSTHYQNWNNVGDLNTHFELGVRSAVDLLNSQARAGNWTYSLFSSGLAIIGFSCLLNIATKLNPKAKRKSKSQKTFLSKLRSPFLPALLVYIISSLLVEHGIKIEFWLLTGMLAWLLVTDQIVRACIAYQDLVQAQGSHRGQVAQNSVALLLMAVGTIQLIWTSLRWGFSEQWLYTGSAGLILVVALFIWKDQIIPLIIPFRSTATPTLFR